MNSKDFSNQTEPKSFPGTRLPRYQGVRRKLPDHEQAEEAEETEETPLYEEEFDPKQREAVLAAIKTLIQEGNVHRIKIVDDYGTVLHEVSLTSGVLGVVLFPSIASLIGLAAMAGKRKIVVERSASTAR
jgi:hypothetical protein